jgi:hypothetical protein
MGLPNVPALHPQGAMHPQGAEASTKSNLSDSILTSLMNLIKEANIEGIDRENFVTAQRVSIPGQTGYVLCQMSSEAVKDKLYSQRVKFRNCKTRIYINEDLTREVSLQFKKARDNVKQGLLHSTWTVNGRVWAKTTKEGKPFLVKDI